MIKKYLLILMESLEKKAKVLDEILKENENQLKAATAEPFDGAKFDEVADRKDQLIEEILKLDEGFETVYERISEAGNLEQEKEKYADEIEKLQGLIRSVTDKSIAIEASEYRNKAQIEKMFREENSRIKEGRRSAKVAMDYYKNMSRVNYVDPQLIDRKK